ncbi:MAG: hypothetical protein IPO16_09835 [Saprospiraceae bacterium]|nr:hypothetical protein [Saprospiraceae bacterium]
MRIELPLERKAGYMLYLKLFAGLFAGFILCLLGLFVTVDSVARFSLHVAGIITAITNKLNVDKLIPQHFSFTLSDYTHLICFEGMLLIIFVSTIQLSDLRRYQVPTQTNPLQLSQGPIIHTKYAELHFYAGVFWATVIAIYIARPGGRNLPPSPKTNQRAPQRGCFF